MTEILFEEQFLAETSGSGKYLDFIGRLRVKLKKNSSHNRPQLLMYKEIPTVFFKVTISTNTHTVMFWFRADNLYLIGYRVVDAPASHWLEFSNQRGIHLINDRDVVAPNDWLTFEGDYPDLVRIAKEKLENIRIGIHDLVTAINRLTVPVRHGENWAPIAHSLIVVIVMICEATRLNPVLNEIVTNFNVSPLIGGTMVNLINSWSELSKVVLWADADERDKFILRPENQVVIPPDNRRITTLAQVLEVIGILLGVCFHDRRPKPRLANSNSDSDSNSNTIISSCCETEEVDDDQGQCFVGSPLLQVFTVRLDYTDDEKIEELYGTIIINNGLYTEYIYNRPRDNYQSIKKDHDLTLVGPSYCVSALGNFTIKLKLTDQDFEPWDDDLIIDEEISWNAMEIGNEYDKLITQGVSGPHGKATVNYAVLRNAVSAKITITVQSDCKLCGFADAYYTHYWFNDTATDLSLFKIPTATNYEFVGSMQNIPLLRSVIAVPVDNSLEVNDHRSLYVLFSL